MLQRNQKSQRRHERGFTLIEIMVAIVVLTIGLLGMAGITIVIMQGNQLSIRMSDATVLSQEMLERLKDVTFSELGTDVSCPGNASSADNDISFGRAQEICKQINLNAQGQTCPSFGSCNPEFRYTRHILICDQADPNAIGDRTSGNWKTRCDYDDILTADDVPPQLTCEVANLNPNEKRITVLTTWWERGKRKQDDGISDTAACKGAALSTTVAF